MRCTRCGYISFKAQKKCENCGAAAAKVKNSRSLRKQNEFEEKPFTIFPQGNEGLSYPPPRSPEPDISDDNASYMTPPGRVVHPVFNAEGDFELDLSDAVAAASEQEPDTAKDTGSATSAFGFEIPSEIYDGDEELDEIDLGEIEVEGLGFEGLDAEFSVPAEEAEQVRNKTKLELTELHGEPVEEPSDEAPSILDELDLDFDPDEDEEAPAKGSNSKKTS